MHLSDSKRRAAFINALSFLTFYRLSKSAQLERKSTTRYGES